MSGWRAFTNLQDLRESTTTNLMQPATVYERQEPPSLAGSDDTTAAGLEYSPPDTRPLAYLHSGSEVPAFYMPFQADSEEDVDMNEVDVPGASIPSDQASVVEPHLVSRHANRGLNARPLKVIGRERSAFGRNTRASDPARHEPASLTTYQRKVMEEKEDLDEFEAVQLLSGVPRTDRDWVAFREGVHSSITKSSEAVNSESVRDRTGMPQKPMTTVDPTFDHSMFAADDLSAQLLKTRTLAEKNITKLEFEAAVAELLGEAEQPWSDDKYFVLENYLKHAEQSRDKETDTEETEITTEQEPENIPPKSDVLIDLLKKVIGPENNGEAGMKKGATKAKSSDDKHLQISRRSLRSSSPVQEAESSSDMHDEADGIDTTSAAVHVNQKEKGKWELIDGNTDPVTLGESAPDNFCIRLRNKETEESETYTFAGLSCRSMKWSDKAHVHMINKWRYDVFRNHGIAAKRINILFHPEEDAWLTLFHHKLRVVVEAGHNIQMPGPTPTVKALNKFFVGRVLQDSDGEDMLPRAPREEVSMKAKLNHANFGVKSMRDAIRKSLESKKGGVLYVPVMTEHELSQYQSDGSIAADDPKDEEKNSALSNIAERKRSPPKRKREVSDTEGADEKRNKQ
jgi:hypothetical protein